MFDAPFRFGNDFDVYGLRRRRHDDPDDSGECRNFGNHPRINMAGLSISKDRVESVGGVSHEMDERAVRVGRPSFLQIDAAIKHFGAERIAKRLVFAFFEKFFTPHRSRFGKGWKIGCEVQSRFHRNFHRRNQLVAYGREFRRRYFRKNVGVERFGRKEFGRKGFCGHRGTTGVTSAKRIMPPPFSQSRNSGCRGLRRR